MRKLVLVLFETWVSKALCPAMPVVITSPPVRRKAVMLLWRLLVSRFSALVLVFSVLLSAQPPAVAQDSVASLQKQITNLKNQVQALDRELTDFARLYHDKLDNIAAESVVLDPTSQKFGVLTTMSGRFFIRLDQIEPLGDGYRITLAVGNPYEATFIGLKVGLDWNRKMPSDFSKYREWLKGRRSLEVNEGPELRAGSWTTIPLVLHDTKADQLGYLEVKLSTSGVKLAE
jgi:hypothetical protein